MTRELAENFECSNAPLVEVLHQGPVAIVTMAREAKRNAMNGALLGSLRDSLQAQADDPRIRAVVLTGRGSVFSAGADRSAVKGLEGAERARVFAPIAVQVTEGLRQVAHVVVSMPQPVVAAVNGAAAGAGMMLALYCDFRVVGQNALMWMPEVELGRALSEPTMNALRIQLGITRAKDIAMSARRIAASDLHAWGVANSVVPEHEVLERSVSLAQGLIEREPLILGQIKRRANVELEHFLSRGPH